MADSISQGRHCFCCWSALHGGLLRPPAALLLLLTPATVGDGVRCLAPLNPASALCMLLVLLGSCTSMYLTPAVLAYAIL
jgi:hypothetical protein